MTDTLAAAHDVHVTFPINRGLLKTPDRLQAVRGVSLEIKPGETLGIVGESGCGKSTLARAILRLVPLSAGSVSWRGADISQAGNDELKTLRQKTQLIFQDPIASLDPRMRLEQAVEEPLLTHRADMSAAERRQAVAEMLGNVGLDPEVGRRYPHEVSGGQAQRVGIARAMIGRPDLIVCDEPVAALDVSIKAQIMNLLKDLQRRTGIALIFISHDMAVVRQIASRVMVIYLGQIIEEGLRDEIFAHPMHPYTCQLLGSVPSADPRIERHRTRASIEGELPSALHPPTGCPYRSRCPRAGAVCAVENPALERKVGGQHRIACHFPIIEAASDQGAPRSVV